MGCDFTHEEYRQHLFSHSILVVDDSERKLGEVGAIAEINGFLCDYARSAPEAWQILIEKPTKFELMICDNSMPSREESDDDYDYSNNDGLTFMAADDMYNEGLQLLRRVREHPQLKNLDVIIYTGGGLKPW